MSDVDKMMAWSAPRVQEDTLSAVKACVPPGGSILELGAGTGRLSVMFKEAGYDVTAGDWNSDQFVPKDIRCHRVDCDDREWLEREFGGRKYDAVVCGDLIEHLRNPFQFIGKVAEFLTSDKGGGNLFVTTPNILSPTSRINMLVNGNPISFGAGGLEMGHINPIFPNTMQIAFRCASLECLKVVGVGASPWLGEQSLRGFGLSLVTLLLRPVMRRATYAPVLLFIAKSAANRAITPDTPVGTGSKGHYSVKG